MGVTPADPYAAVPWRTSYPDSVPADPVVPALALGQLLDEVVARFAPRPALVCRRARLTYSELHGSAAQLSNALHKLGVRAGDRVALILPNTPQAVIGFFAAVKLGAVAVPLNPYSGREELSAQLADSGAEIVICLDRVAADVLAVRDRTKVREVLTVSLAHASGLRERSRLRLTNGQRLRAALSAPVPKGTAVRPLSDALKNVPMVAPKVEVDPHSAAVLAYTSGTSRAPRAAVLTHHNLVANGHQIGWWLPAVRPGREVTLAVLPLFHPYGLVLGLQTTLLLGGLLVLVPGFDQREVLTAFDTLGPTLFSGVPGMFRGLLDNPGVRAYRTVPLRAGVSIGAEIPAATAEAYEQLTGSSLLAGYGLTEAPVTHVNPPGAGRPGSIGVPLPLTEARIVDPHAPTTVLAPGEVGELAVRGPQVSDRSWGGSDSPSAAGFTLTGDLARMDGDGFFTVVGKRSDVLEVAGSSVDCRVVEEVIAALPGVARVGAVMAGAGAGGVVGYVQRVPAGRGENAAPELDAQDILAACAQLPAALVPIRVEFVEDMPLTAVGTVFRRSLRAREAERIRDDPPPESPPESPPDPVPAAVPAKAPRKRAAKPAPAKSTPRKTAPIEDMPRSPARKAPVKKAPVKRAAPQSPAPPEREEAQP